MKRNSSVLAAALCAMLLASCAPSESIPSDTTQPLETTIDTTPVFTEQSAYVTEATELIMTDADGEPITVTEPVDNVLPLSPDFTPLNISFDSTLYRFIELSDGIVCARNGGMVNGTYQYRLYFIDTANDTSHIVDLPPDHDILNIVIDDDDFLCHVFMGGWERYTEEEKITYAIADITWDFEAEIRENLGMEDFTFDYGGRRICEWDENIYDLTDGTKKVIVQGDAMLHDRDFDCKYMSFDMGIDDDRFLYRIAGYESMPGFGVYDYITDTCGVIEDSEDKAAIGVYDNEIYSYDTTWDSLGGRTIYVSDPDTLETKEYLTVIPEEDKDFFAEFFMSKSGKYIVADISNRYCYDVEVQRRLEVIETETGSVVNVYDLGDNNTLDCLAFVSDTQLLCSSNRKCYLLELE